MGCKCSNPVSISFRKTTSQSYLIHENGTVTETDGAHALTTRTGQAHANVMIDAESPDLLLPLGGHWKEKKVFLRVRLEPLVPSVSDPAWDDPVTLSQLHKWKFEL